MLPPDRTAPPPFVEHVVAFVRVLRRAGFTIGSGQVLEALEALRVIGVRRRDDVRQTLSCYFVRRPEDRPLFDQAFALFWRAPDALPEGMEALLPSAPGRAAPRPPGDRRVKDALRINPPPRRPASRPRHEEDTSIQTYSAVEALRTRDFASFSEAEIAAARAYLADFRWTPAPRVTRRSDPYASGRRFDTRRTIRSALRYQGEPLRLHTRGPRRKPRPIVVLCDISGSMERYARMLLHFMHTITGGLCRVESFVFGTRLTRITRPLQRRDVEVALAEVTASVHDWSGGTRIGEALRVFNYTWLRRVLRSGSVVLIISDGWDRGDTEMLAKEMDRLSRSCYRLIWLNPLLGFEDYQPLTRGIRSALPYIDDFLPVHNLASLEQLADVLATLDPGPRTPFAGRDRLKRRDAADS